MTPDISWVLSGCKSKAHLNQFKLNRRKGGLRLRPEGWQEWIAHPPALKVHFLSLFCSVKFRLYPSLKIIFSASLHSGQRMSHFISCPSSNTCLKKISLNRFANNLWNIWFTGNLYLFSASAAKREGDGGALQILRAQTVSQSAQAALAKYCRLQG